MAYGLYKDYVLYDIWTLLVVLNIRVSTPILLVASSSHIAYIDIHNVLLNILFIVIANNGIYNYINNHNVDNHLYRLIMIINHYIQPSKLNNFENYVICIQIQSVFKNTNHLLNINCITLNVIILLYVLKCTVSTIMIYYMHYIVYNLFYIMYNSPIYYLQIKLCKSQQLYGFSTINIIIMLGLLESIKMRGVIGPNVQHRKIFYQYGDTNSIIYIIPYYNYEYTTIRSSNNSNNCCLLSFNIYCLARLSDMLLSFQNIIISLCFSGSVPVCTDHFINSLHLHLYIHLDCLLCLSSHLSLSRHRERSLSLIILHYITMYNYVTVDLYIHFYTHTYTHTHTI